jgi:hypothetical protein
MVFNSFLLGVKLWEESHEKSMFWKFSFVILQVNGKGERWHKDKTCTIIWLGFAWPGVRVNAAACAGWGVSATDGCWNWAASITGGCAGGCAAILLSHWDLVSTILRCESVEIQRAYCIVWAEEAWGIVALLSSVAVSNHCRVSSGPN